MRDFETQGLFHMPADPSKIVAGQLVYSTADGLILRLTGTFRDQLDLPSGIKYPVIFGVIADSPYGRHVTLLDCFPRKTTLAFGGLSTEELRANRAYVGGEVLSSEANARFESVSLRYSYLQEWTGLSGMHLGLGAPSDRATLSVEYRAPSAFELRAGDQIAKFETIASTRQIGSTWEITEDAWLTVQGLVKLSPLAVFRDIIAPLQDFFTLAADRPSPVEEIEFQNARLDQGPHMRRGLHFVYQPLYASSKERARNPVDERLFGWSDISLAHPHILSEWLTFRAKHRAACDIFFGLVYGAPAYLETRYLLLVNALGLLLANRGPDDGTIPDVVRFLGSQAPIDRDSRWLRIMPDRDELSVPWTTYALLQDHADLMAPVIGDLEDFVTQFVMARRDLFRREVPLDEQFGVRASQVQLLTLIERLTLLLKIGMLDLLGFSVGEVRQFVSRSRRYAMLKAGFPK